MIRKIKVLFLFTFLLVLSWKVRSQGFIPGNAYYNSYSYVKYQAGNLPVIISVPHGGYLQPEDIPDRDCSGCSNVMDSYTQELSQELSEAIFKKTSCYPHVITNLLHRKKFDANRELETAADGNADVTQCWYDYHSFIDTAAAFITEKFQKGLFIDLHGHGHTIQRIELGYLLSAGELAYSDSLLNTPKYTDDNSIRSLADNNLNGLMFSDLLRGEKSLGELLVKRGYPAVPSQTDPFPKSGDSYFNGGYNTLIHGSLQSGTIDAIQMECNSGIRFDTSKRKQFADSLANVISIYLDYHYFDDFDTKPCLTTNGNSLNGQLLSIAPNPACNYIQLMNSCDHPVRIYLYNQLGMLVKSLERLSDCQFEISDIPDGLYVVEVLTDTGEHTLQKLVKNCN